MAASPARKFAYEVLLRADAGRTFAVDLLQAPAFSALKDSDQRLAMEIVMGVLRWRGELDFQIEHLSGKKPVKFDREVLTVLRMGIYQIRLLERVPKHATVNDAVELTKFAHKRSAAGLVNAVLRKCDPPQERIGGRFERLTPAGRETVRRTLPAWLLQRWKLITATTLESGNEGALRLAYASLVTPPTTLRVVDAGAKLEEVRRELAAEGVSTSRCVYAEQRALHVEDGRVQNTAAYRESRVVIQDEASQLVAELVAPERGQRVLDLCAAPGMKTSQLAQMLGAGKLVACDSSAPRLRTMARSLPRWVPTGVRLLAVRIDATSEPPFGAGFDRILLDAPCSGTGTLARNPEIKWRLRPEDITRLAASQAAMLRNALPLLAESGRLIYATCSLEPEENERVVESILNDLPGFRLLSSHELALEHPRLIPLFDSRGYFRTRPDEHVMDGFNAAIIVRR